MLFPSMAQMLSVPPLPLVIVSIALLSFGILSWRYWKKQQAYQSLQTVPSPPSHWLLGNAPQLLAAVKKRQLFQLLFDWSQQYGPTYVYWVRYPVLVLTKPLAIENTIINGTREGSLVRSETGKRAWNDISGPILLGQSGAEWQWRRKAWNPEFSTSGLAEYTAVVQQACAQTIDQIKTIAPSEIVYADRLFVELTMRVIACLLLGIPVDSKAASPEGPPLDIQKVYDAMTVMTYRFLRVATGERPWQKYLPTPSARHYWSARRYLEHFLAARIDLALQLRDQATVNADTISPLFQKSMLVKIATKEPRYTRKDLIAEAIELLIAGTDTTAHTLSFALGELALHSDIFQKARSIVDQVWQQHGALTADSLKDLTYLRAIVKETLRLYSVASGSTSLQVVKQTVVEGITVPPGTRIFWSMLAAGRDAEVYSQPEEFRPERWLAEEISALPMVSFGSGAHRCLGEHLAMLEATLMLAQLLRHFDWQLVNDRSSLENLQQNLLIYPADGMPVRFKARDASLVGS